ncbi:MAG: thermonuclease family protein [Alphaproteobacteria bacterium]|nr:thermonuclease family protein [Alphaproteobacteria bacterium]
MKRNIFRTAVLLIAVLDAPSVAAAAEGAAVKKSGSGICHCPGGQYYGRTKNFTPFDSIEACLDSGGRHPKRGQGDCVKAAPAKPKSERSVKPTRAIDGDTLTLKGVMVRLQGIDAPESGQSCRNAQNRPYPCGAVATAALKLMLASGGVRCDFEPKPGRYGRKIGYCYASDGTDINRWMVRQGFAVAYREYSKRYIKAEEAARKAKTGLWQGAFVLPWKWRRGKRLPK